MFCYNWRLTLAPRLCSSLSVVLLHVSMPESLICLSSSSRECPASPRPKCTIFLGDDTRFISDSEWCRMWWEEEGGATAPVGDDFAPWPGGIPGWLLVPAVAGLDVMSNSPDPEVTRIRSQAANWYLFQDRRTFWESIFVAADVHFKVIVCFLRERVILCFWKISSFSWLRGDWTRFL